MGKKFDEYTESGHIVGADDEEEEKDENDKSIEMACAQNDIEDTSCAIDDDEKEDGKKPVTAMV